MEQANAESIRQIAYKIWEDKGRPQGHELEHWSRAQAIWRKEQTSLVAYQIWEDEGHPQGRDLNHWLMAETFMLANSERALRNIKPLVWDNELARIAGAHSQEMAIRGELFHSPIHKRYAENCWRGSSNYHTATDIVSTWMQSNKHRTWLLCPNLKHIGVGVAISDRGMYASWTYWRSETKDSDWWYVYGSSPPSWWY